MKHKQDAIDLANKLTKQLVDSGIEEKQATISLIQLLGYMDSFVIQGWRSVHLRAKNYLESLSDSDTIEKPNPDALTDSQLWRIIESAQWAKEHDYEKAQGIFNVLTPNEYDQLEKFYEKEQSELYIKYEKDWLGDPGIGVSDDGWSDLTAEVVGRGEKFFNGITVKKLQKMADTNDYHENFGYSFQSI